MKGVDGGIRARAEYSINCDHATNHKMDGTETTAESVGIIFRTAEMTFN